MPPRPGIVAVDVAGVLLDLDRDVTPVAVVPGAPVPTLPAPTIFELDITPVDGEINPFSDQRTEQLSVR